MTSPDSAATPMRIASEPAPSEPPPRLAYVSPESRVFDREGLISEVAALREGGARVVLSRGAFESLDAATVLRLHAARRLGDVLIVAVSPEGERSADDRMLAVAGLECVSAVALDDPAAESPLAEGLLESIRPDRLG